LESDVTVYEPRWLLDSNFNVVENQLIIEENGKIVYLGKKNGANNYIPVDSIRKKYPHGLLLPGMINAHTHICEVLLRGLCDDQSLDVWLWEKVWKVEPEMTPEDAYIGAKLGIAEMIANGVIGFNDQYFFSGEISRAVTDTGVKAYLAPTMGLPEGVFERNPETRSIEGGFQKAKDVHDIWHGKDNRLFIGFGPHAPYTVDKEWLLEINEAAKERNVKIHIHLSETKSEVETSKKEWGVSPIERMVELDILERTMAAHCIYIDDRDRELLAKNKTLVLSCPQSNLKIAAGVCNIPELLKRGVSVCLGTDGQASNNNLDVLEEVTLTALIHKGLHNDPTLIDASTALKTVTVNSSNIFPEGVYSGVIKTGSPADLIIADLSRVNTVPIINPLSNFVYASNGSNIVLTACNGKILYENGLFTTLSIEELKIKAQKITERMIQASGILERQKT
jgi:5-methylthioadenosine/S-adenosylhomocysteine deaminase